MARLLLHLASAMVLGAAASVGDPPVQRGYAASFQGPTAIAGIRAGQIDWDAQGWAALDTELTWSAWVRYSPHVDDTGALFRIVTAAGNYLFDMQVYGADLSWSTWTWFYTDEVNYPGFGEWVHEAVTIRDGVATAYVNGRATSIATVGPDYTLRQPNATLYLGSLLYVGGPINKMVRNNMNGRFNGDVDEVMLFARALSEVELQKLMAGPYALSGGPDDPVLYFSFDQAPADPLMQGSVSGTYVCANLGSAGRDYDLLMGQLNDDYGRGTTYVDKADVWNTPLRWSVPRAHASSVPWAASEWSLDASVPLVYEVAPGGVADVPLPSNRSGLRMGQVLPVHGTVSSGSDALNNATLASGSDLSNETFVRFWSVASLAGPVFFTLEQGSVVQEVHVWPSNAPVLIDADAVKDVFTFQDEPVNILLGSDYTSNVGEEVELEITSLPHGGLLQTYDVDLGWDPASASPIDTVPARLAQKGLAVTFSPDPGFRGLDQFAVVFRSPATGLSSVALTVNVDVRFIDTDAQCEPLGHTVVLDEDQVGGVAGIVLKARDKEQRFGLARFISKLPERGDLYATSEIGEERRVTAPFNSFGEIGAVVRQYASRVEAVSTIGVTDDPLKAHPLNTLGSPTCNEKGRTFNDNCISTRFWGGASWKGWMPPAGDIIRANKLFNASRAYNESEPRLLVAASVVKGPYRGVGADGNETLLIDARVLLTYKDDGNGTCVRCEMVGPTYPDDCDAAAAMTETEQSRLLVGLSWNEIDIQRVSGPARRRPARQACN